MFRSWLVVWATLLPFAALAGPSFAAPTSFAPLVAQVRDGVVNIRAENEEGTASLGSGFLIGAASHVVTNDHVVARARTLTVTFPNGFETSAQVLGRDAEVDLAVLALADHPANAKSLRWGNSDALEPGDWLLAIGNPFGFQTSVTQGIVSALDRSLGHGRYDEFIQTNLILHPGSSGGPILNMRAEVVGVSTASVDGGPGISFAVPSNLARGLVATLAAGGKTSRGWLGLSARESPRPGGGSRLMLTPRADGPAAAAGVQAGDELTSIDGRRVATVRDLARRLALLQPGSAVQLRLGRSGQVVLVSVILVERPKAAAENSSP